jgi:hypothetical protein
MATETRDTSSGLTRWDISINGFEDGWSSTPSPSGDWCRYSDAAALLQKAIEQLTGDTANRWDAQQAMANELRAALSIPSPPPSGDSPNE